MPVNRRRPDLRPSFTFDQLAALLLLVASVTFMFGLVSRYTQIQTQTYTPLQKRPQIYNEVLAAQTGSPLELPTTGTASIDDDPVMGSVSAPVTLIAFTDFECPYCRKFFLNTLPELQSYLDSGQLKIVFRDLPVAFHEPVASLEAVAANCARQQGGDSAYFAFQKRIFQQTRSNGNGLGRPQLVQLASELNLKSLRFELCLSEPEITEEIAKDVQAAEEMGVVGTPTFLIGKSTIDGQITGSIILGARSLLAFEEAIAKAQ